MLAGWTIFFVFLPFIVFTYGHFVEYMNNVCNEHAADGGGGGGQCDVNIPSYRARRPLLMTTGTARVWTLNPMNSLLRRCHCGPGCGGGGGQARHNSSNGGGVTGRVGHNSSYTNTYRNRRKMASVIRLPCNILMYLSCCISQSSEFVVTVHFMGAAKSIYLYTTCKKPF